MRSLLTLVWLALAAFVLAGCDAKPPQSAPQTSPPAQTTLSVLAGSELKDLTDPGKGNLAEEIRKATGVRLAFTFAGSLDAVDRIRAGEAYDAAWVSHGKYLALTPGVREKIRAQEKTMLSPVILAVKQSKAQALGWDNNLAVTWQDIAKVAGADKLALAITNPTSSNTGFAAITGLAAALAGTGEALSASDIKADRLADFYKAQKLTSGSSGWLAEAYEREQDRLDGMVNYESVILSMNVSGRLREKLVPIYPKEGIITADYPLMLLNESKRPAYAKLVAHVRSPAFQEALMKATLRRPVNPDVALDSVFSKALLVELPFPGSIEVIDTLLSRFLSDIRVPATAYYVLDTSGSMGSGNPSRIQRLKLAMFGLLGDDQSTSGRFSRFQPRERIKLLRFASSVDPTRAFEIGSDPDSNRTSLQELRDTVEGLTAHGGTALYEAIRNAYREALASRDSKAPRYFTIVVLTDGQNTGDFRFEQFKAYFEALPADSRTIKVFPVLFGEAKVEEMEELARLTGGRTFDARKATLATVLKDIRGYQ